MTRLGSIKAALLAFCMMCVTSVSSAVTVNDSQGEFTIDTTPKRIVVLEFSFADALAAVDVSPVGIADDNDPERVLSDVREIIGTWQSVGTRSQPSLEVIASLKPDLIIADISRHAGVYEDLKKIAPTLILPSRRETYADNLKAASIIGKVVGKEAQMQARLAKHETLMDQFKHSLPEGEQVQFAVAREKSLFLHTEDSYAGGVLTRLGMQVPEFNRDDSASREVSLEQMLTVNPNYLIVGKYTSPNVLDSWAQEPLWQMTKAVQQKHLYFVNANVWARCRGILAAERMAQDLIDVLAQP